VASAEPIAGRVVSALRGGRPHVWLAPGYVRFHDRSVKLG
jgi:hypothetical protein